LKFDGGGLKHDFRIWNLYKIFKIMIAAIQISLAPPIYQKYIFGLELC